VPERRRRRGRSTVAVNLRAQLFPGEQISRDECEVIESTLEDRLRQNDRYCFCDDGSYVVVLAAITEDEALIVAQRLAAEVTLRVTRVNRRTWRASIAGYPRDATTAAALHRLSRTGARRAAVR
jgi:hypothetical protein